MIIYESFLEKTPLVRKLLGGLSPPPPRAPPLPTALIYMTVEITSMAKYTYIQKNVAILVTRETTTIIKNVAINVTSEITTNHERRDTCHERNNH